MSIDELVAYLNDLKVVQKELTLSENFSKSDYDEYFHNSMVAEGLSPDKRRWYEKSITVFKYYDCFFGVTHVNQMFSESGDVEDVYHTLTFKEMKEVQTTTYA